MHHDGAARFRSDFATLLGNGVAVLEPSVARADARGTEGAPRLYQQAYITEGDFRSSRTQRYVKRDSMSFGDEPLLTLEDGG